MAIKKLDCLSELCPIPLLRGMQELKKMGPGDILIIHADHSCATIDIEKWALEKSYPVKTMEVGQGEWEIYIQKPKENLGDVK